MTFDTNYAKRKFLMKRQCAALVAALILAAFAGHVQAAGSADRLVEAGEHGSVAAGRTPSDLGAATITLNRILAGIEANGARLLGREIVGGEGMVWAFELENPAVAILEQLANALDTKIVEFFVVPAPDEPPPKPLRGGRRPKR
jgi:hypothetical protein